MIIKVYFFESSVLQYCTIIVILLEIATKNDRIDKERVDVWCPFEDWTFSLAFVEIGVYEHCSVAT